MPVFVRNLYWIHNFNSDTCIRPIAVHLEVLKVFPAHPMKVCRGQWRYTSTQPRKWMKLSSQLPAPAAVPSGKIFRCTLTRRLGGPRSRSGWVWKGENILPSLEFEPLTLHPVTTCYTNYPFVSPCPFLSCWNLVFKRESSNNNFSSTLSSTSRSPNWSIYSNISDIFFKINICVVT